MARLLQQARALRGLESQLGDLIPSPLDEHCRLLSFRGNTLVLAADSPVWAARLRFHAPLLLKQLSVNQTVNLRTVQVRVRPPDMPPGTGRSSARPHLSGQNAVILNQAARGVTDPGLKAALERLARRRKPSGRQ